MYNTESIKNAPEPLRITDTAEWRQIINISEDGIVVYLKNLDNPTMPVQNVFSSIWDSGEETMLRNIENAVYDHPRMLDDFSTDIIIETPRALWAPTAELDEEGMEETIYTAVYPAQADDIMTDTLGDMTCLYSLAGGLNAFMRRTFAGARILCHLTPAVEKFRERGGEMPCIYVDIRDKAADFYAFDGKRMLMCAAHAWRDINDIAYHIFNIINVYGLDPGNLQVSLSGRRDEKRELMPMLRRSIAYVMLTMLPKLAGDDDMGLAASLCAHRQSKIGNQSVK